MNNSSIFYMVAADDLEELARRLVVKIRQADAEDRAKVEAEELGSRQDAASYLGVSLPTIHQLINAGQLKAAKIGRRTVIDMGDLRRRVASGELGKYHRRAGNE